MLGTCVLTVWNKGFRLLIAAVIQTARGVRRDYRTMALTNRKSSSLQQVVAIMTEYVCVFILHVNGFDMVHVIDIVRY